MNTLAPSLLIGSSSYLQDNAPEKVLHLMGEEEEVIRTSITSRTSSKFGQIGPRIAELAALGHLENPHRLLMGEILCTL